MEMVVVMVGVDVGETAMVNMNEGLTFVEQTWKVVVVVVEQT